MDKIKINKIALICNIGFSSSWYPFGISLLKENIENSLSIEVNNYYFSSEFTHHINKKYPQYREINDSICEVGRSYHEMFYATRLFKIGEPRKHIKKSLLNMLKNRDIFRKRLQNEDKNYKKLIDMFALYILDYCELIDTYINKKIKYIDWNHYDLVGFSCLSSQLLCSIYFASRLRKKNYKGLIVFGGGMFRKWNIKQYSRMFNFIDEFVAGDGYRYFINKLCYNINKLEKPLNKIQNHFGDYSDIPKNILKSKQFYIPIQLSERCSWSKCMFCSIVPSRNCDFRSPIKLAKWISNFAKRNGVINFGFVDCNLNSNLNELNEFCNYMNEERVKVFFYGMFNTSNIDKDTAVNIKKAGFNNILLGVENFSSKMLALMKKESTKIDNIKTIKWLIEANINRIYFNIIIDFPGTNKKIITENIETMESIIHLIDKYVECNVIEFDLERDSKAYKLKQLLNLTGLSNYENDEMFYPKKIRSKMKFHSIKYIWKRIPKGWNSILIMLNDKNKKYLIYEESGKKLIIYDRRYSDYQFELNFLEGKIYKLICNELLNISDISKRISKDIRVVGGILEKLCELKLAIKEKNKYLGLAIDKKNYCLRN